MHEHYLVVGLGVTGLSVVEYAVKNNIKVSVCDTRSEPPQLAELKAKFPQVPISLGGISIPEGITQIILSPGLAKEELKTDLPIIGDIELFARVVDKPVIAVTGSNGKSTVTTLLGLMAQASNIKAGVGGNLGTPALSLLDPNNDCYILELSSFQLETTSSLKPLVSTVLNISPDHMDRYSELRDYQQAKLRIYNNADYAVYNLADDLTIPPANTAKNIIGFGLEKIDGLAMLGLHNLANASAALKMGEIAGFNKDSMLKVLREFKGLEHRCEHVITADEVVWINDSKGTNPAATVAALEGLATSIPGKWLIILGGTGKNADFSCLVEPVQRHCRAAILIGQEQETLLHLLQQKINCYKAKDLAEAVLIAKQCSRNGDGVLLSPACASFDMFNNYMHRGEVFKQYARSTACATA